ncbi:diguanylate cyclase domain-containing protein [Radiobacillus deserti]|uniref:Diguanylate cyclase n=1 Tax=Radiobacillus deserti TaxID=2594883 RepID=A0A516KDS4_9BACI|nr:diguanylate cyclase [Radiobacillus deserti]QDP39555.1 diguanylate cyclase [Radiobacillus deserti]
MFEKLRNFRNLDLIFNSISDMVFLISVGNDGVFRYVTANEVAIKLLNFPKDYSGKSLENLMPASSVNIIKEKYKKAIESEETVTYEDRIAFPAHPETSVSNYVWVESRVTPIINENGTCEYLISITRDITEVKNRQKELSRTKEELELIFHHVADAIFTFDENGDYVSVNPSYTNMFGWTNREIKENPKISILTSEEKDRFSEILNYLRSGRVIEAHKSRRITKDSKIINVLSSYSPIMDEGKFKGGVAVYKDVEKIKSLKNKLKETENRYRVIVEHTNDLISVTDKEGIILYASPSHEQATNMSPDFFVSKSFLSFIHREDMLKVENFFQNILETERSSEIEYRRLNKNGVALWVHTKGAPVLNDDGEIEQIVFVSRDISNRVEREKELEMLALFDELTGLPNRHLFNKQLEIALKKANYKETVTAVLMMDCDNFKSINDSYGHDVGDEVIIQFAKRIQESVRNVDTVSRFGGDEFQVVLPRADDKESVRDICQKIVGAVEQPISINSDTVHITASIGIAYYENGKDAKTLLKEADEALYTSKKSGKNMFTEYQPPKTNIWKRILSNVSKNESN